VPPPPSRLHEEENKGQGNEAEDVETKRRGPRARGARAAVPHETTLKTGEQKVVRRSRAQEPSVDALPRMISTMPTAQRRPLI
jgi:hypothetical protein